MGIKKPCSQSHLTHPGHGGTCLIQLSQRRLLCCRCDVWISQGVPERDPKAQTSLERTETEEVPCRARAQIPALSQNVAGTATTSSCHTTSSHSAPLWVDWGLHREMVMGSLVAQGHGPVLAAELQGSTQATRGKGNGYQRMDMPPAQSCEDCACACDFHGLSPNTCNAKRGAYKESRDCRSRCHGHQHSPVVLSLYTASSVASPRFILPAL